MTFQLIKAREEKGLTQSEAAQAIGVDQSKISKVEHQKERFDLWQLIAYAQAHNTSVSAWLRAIRDSEYLPGAEKTFIDEGFFGDD